MTKIYDQHDKAFSQVSAYVLMKGKEQIGTIALKYPKDGAGRLYAYVHVHGLEMVRGFAGGYGYDKRSAAIQSALSNIVLAKKDEYMTQDDADRFNKPVIKLWKAMDNMSAGDWQRDIEKQGFKVLRAI